MATSPHPTDTRCMSCAYPLEGLNSLDCPLCGRRNSTLEFVAAGERLAWETSFAVLGVSVLVSATLLGVTTEGAAVHAALAGVLGVAAAVGIFLARRMISQGFVWPLATAAVPAWHVLAWTLEPTWASAALGHTFALLIGAAGAFGAYRMLIPRQTRRAGRRAARSLAEAEA